MNGTIRKIAPSGAVTTFASGFSNSYRIAFDPAGSLWVADAGNNALRKVNPAGVVSTLVGPGVFNGSPASIAFDPSGNGIVTDESSIRRVSPAGVVSLLAGSPTTQGFSDGSATAARFNQPYGVIVNPAGTMFVTDTSNNRIRVIEAVPALGTTITPDPSTPGQTVTVRFSQACVDAIGPNTIYVSGPNNPTSTGTVLGTQLSTQTPPGTWSFPAPSTPGIYALFNAPNGCGGQFVVAEDGAVPIIDPRVGAVVVAIGGATMLALRRRRRTGTRK